MSDQTAIITALGVVAVLFIVALGVWWSSLSVEERELDARTELCRVRCELDAGP